MLILVTCLLGVLKLTSSQYYPPIQSGRCPPVPECPPIPASCLNLISQRLGLIPPRAAVIPQNSMLLSRPTLPNGFQVQSPAEQFRSEGLQPVRIPPQSSAYVQPVSPTYTSLNREAAIDNALLNSWAVNQVGTRPMPPGFNMPARGAIIPAQTVQTANFMSAVNDCCGRCSMICQHANRHIRAYNQKSHSVKKADDNCTHMELKAIMRKAMSASADESKRAIQQNAEESLGADFHVICSKEDFSYITKSSTYCQVTENDLTCYAFQTLRMDH